MVVLETVLFPLRERHMSVITNEEEFQKVKDSLQKRGGVSQFRSDRFDELSKFVADSLERQDSDRALTVITR